MNMCEAYVCMSTGLSGVDVIFGWCAEISQVVSLIENSPTT